MSTEKKTDWNAVAWGLITDIPCFWYGAYWLAKIFNLFAESYGVRPMTTAQAAVLGCVIAIVRPYRDFDLTMQWLAEKWGRVLVVPLLSYGLALIAVRWF